MSCSNVRQQKWYGIVVVLVVFMTHKELSHFKIFPAEWEVFMMILWGLWTRRNKHFHGQLNGREGNVEVIAKVVL